MRSGTWASTKQTTFSKNNKIEAHLDTAAKRIVGMSKVAHIIVFNELHAAHQAGLDRRLADHECISMVGALRRRPRLVPHHN